MGVDEAVQRYGHGKSALAEGLRLICLCAITFLKLVDGVGRPRRRYLACMSYHQTRPTESKMKKTKRFYPQEVLQLGDQSILIANLFGESSLEVSRLAAVRLVEHCCVLVAAASCPRPLRPAHAALRPLPINGIAASNRPPATAGKWAIPSHAGPIR